MRNLWNWWKARLASQSRQNRKKPKRIRRDGIQPHEQKYFHGSLPNMPRLYSQEPKRIEGEGMATLRITIYGMKCALCMRKRVVNGLDVSGTLLIQGELTQDPYQVVNYLMDEGFVEEGSILAVRVCVN